MLTGEACEGRAVGPVRLEKKRDVKSSMAGESVAWDSTTYIKYQWQIIKDDAITTSLKAIAS